MLKKNYLNDRQRLIVKMTSEGKSPNEISEVLGIGRSTVYQHLRTPIIRETLEFINQEFVRNLAQETVARSC